MVGEPTSAAPAELVLAAGSPAVASSVVPAASGASDVAAAPALAIHVPASLDRSQPAQVLLVLHGMNGSGQEMVGPFSEYAERFGWVVVAPTLQYRDWRDPEQVRIDDREKLAALHSLLSDLPGQLAMPVRSRAIVFGFSRGGQLAQRLALFYPDLVRGVAMAGAGTYTLPVASLGPEQGSAALPFPYGIADLAGYTGRPFDPAALRQVSFLVAVGAQDNRVSDVPRQWDALIGATRVERAQAFVHSLQGLDVRADLRIVPNVDHEVTSGMRLQACEFLRGLSS